MTKAAKLKKAAQTTAHCGLKTRVDTTVAMEFAASCRPLRKSNAKASRINSHTTKGNDVHATVPKCSVAVRKKSNTLKSL